MDRSTRHRIVRLALCALVAALIAFPAPAFAADTTFTITGRGFGHGIGLSQYGAQGYATQGWSYDRILTWYFHDTRLETRVEPQVKVNLDKAKAARSSWRVSAGSAGTTLTVADSLVGSVPATVAPGATVWITFASGKAQLRADVYSSTTKVHSPSTKVLRTFEGPCTVSTGALATSTVCINSDSGPYPNPNVVWRGQIRFSPASGTANTGYAVDYVLLEQYVQGVIPGEVPNSWKPEALKAQAVAARSYAYGSAVSGSTLWCDTHSQMYVGKSGEHSETNAAVAATAHEVVVYGSQVVTTYFSSCAGGHTANIEDVWVSSTPQPYYTGVDSADAAGGSPNASSWGAPIVKTATTLGQTLRAADTGHSWTPSVSAAVSNVTVQYAASGSGFGRYVVIDWSNGASYKVAGTTFQSALGLRSSKFTVVRTIPQLPTPPVTSGATRVEQDASGVVKSGTWATQPASVHSGAAYAYSKTAGSKMTLAFKGTGIVVVGPIYPTFGRFSVSLDGTATKTVSQYGDVPGFQQHLVEFTGLPSKVHTLTVTVLGTKDAASGGTNVGIDAFDIFGTIVLPATSTPPPAPVSRIQQNATSVTRTGTWRTVGASVHSGGSYAYANAKASLTFRFSGVGAKLIAPRYPNFGRMNIYVDGRYVATKSLYASRAAYQQVIYSASGMRSGSHTVTVKWTGTRDRGSRGTVIGVDALDVVSGS